MKFSSGAQSFFVTGTDTGVGKTLVTAVLAAYFKQKKIQVGIVKPIQTGPDDDALLVKKLARLSPEQIFTPLHLKHPLAPQQAAELAQLPHIDTVKLVKQIKDFTQHFRVNLIEGSGGLYVPIRKNYFMLDLIQSLALSVILVSRTGLGTINHTLLSIQALKKKRQKIWGIIYTAEKKAEDLSAQLNPVIIAEQTGIRTLGVLPFQSRIDVNKLTSYLKL